MKKLTFLACVLLACCTMTAVWAQSPAIPDGFASVDAGRPNTTEGGRRDATRAPRAAEGQLAPSFAGLDRYIASHLAYPEAARENGVEGQVMLQLAIGADGRVEDAQVVEGLGLGCEEAAVALAMNMPAWTPATQSGIPVRSRALIALNFRIR